MIIRDQRIRSRDDKYGVVRMLEDQDNLGDKRLLEDLFWVRMRDERSRERRILGNLWWFVFVVLCVYRAGEKSF